MHYRTNVPSARNRIKLQQHLFSFLLCFLIIRCWLIFLPGTRRMRPPAKAPGMSPFLFLTAHLDHPVTVEELAFLCHTSLSTFKRRFAKIYGTSPNKWLLEKRMQKAARLLKQGEYKASDIYVDLGYENLSSFVQSFKQVYGITPKQYQLSN